jgi:hypothetical protein
MCTEWVGTLPSPEAARIKSASPRWLSFRMGVRNIESTVRLIVFGRGFSPAYPLSARLSALDVKSRKSGPV